MIGANPIQSILKLIGGKHMWLNESSTDKIPAVHPQYKSIAQVLQRAFEHASSDKGHIRHGDDEKFEDQISCWIQKHGFDYARGQATKKIHESLRLDDEAAVWELLGAINCCVIAIIDLEKE